MTLFQVTAVGLLAMAIAAELVGLRRGSGRILPRLARFLLWTAAAAAIALPSLTSQLAHLVGIGRGADLVFYLYILVSMAAMFHLYARSVALDRKLTQLIRNDALRNAVTDESSHAARQTDHGEPTCDLEPPLSRAMQRVPEDEA